VSGENQHRLRDELLSVLSPYIHDRKVTEIKAAVAAMGALAVVCAILPKPARDKLVEELCDALGPHADKRATEIRSGDFDLKLERSRQ
jgi:hypothetical protein